MRMRAPGSLGNWLRNVKFQYAAVPLRAGGQFTLLPMPGIGPGPGPATSTKLKRRQLESTRSSTLTKLVVHFLQAVCRWGSKGQGPLVLKPTRHWHAGKAPVASETSAPVTVPCMILESPPISDLHHDTDALSHTASVHVYSGRSTYSDSRW